jgi:hypothetical protein
MLLGRYMAVLMPGLYDVFKINQESFLSNYPELPLDWHLVTLSLPEVDYPNSVLIIIKHVIFYK